MAEIQLELEVEEKSGEKNFKKVLKFAGVGIAATIVDFLTYQFSLNILFKDNLAISAVVSGVVATFAAYIMHNNITWKERDPGKYGVVKFVIWNAIAVFGLRPPLTWLFSTCFDWLYGFIYFLTSWIFNYEFVKSTGVYVLMTLVIMFLNFAVYEKLVFTKECSVEGEKVDVKGVRQAREEKKSNGVSKKKSK